MSQPLVLHRTRSEIQLLQLTQAAERLNARTLNPDSRERKPAQARQPAEIGKAAIRNRREIQIQLAQRGQLRQPDESGVTYIGGFQIQPLDMRQRLQVSELSIGETRSRQRDGLNVAV